MGRGSGRGGRRGGRGTGNAAKERTTLAEHRFQVGMMSQASEFVKVRNFLINHIWKTYRHGNNIGDALDNSQEPDTNDWIPAVRKYWMKNADPDLEDEANDMIKMIQKEEVHNYMTRKLVYETNRGKVFALIWEQCDSGMQESIKARSNFQTYIKGSPINLLATIREEALSYQPHKYGMSIINNSMRNLLNMKQKEGESVVNYSKRFEAAWDVMLNHLGGNLVLTKMIKEHDNYVSLTDPSSALIAREMEEAYFAYCYTDGADRSRYGGLIATLEEQFNLYNNQYPATLADAVKTLKAHNVVLTQPDAILPVPLAPMRHYVSQEVDLCRLWFA